MALRSLIAANSRMMRQVPSVTAISQPCNVRRGMVPVRSQVGGIGHDDLPTKEAAGSLSPMLVRQWPPRHTARRKPGVEAVEHHRNRASIVAPNSQLPLRRSHVVGARDKGMAGRDKPRNFFNVAFSNAD